MSNHRRRLLYIDHTPFAGGAQLVLAEHILVLDRQKFDPYLLCSSSVPELLDKYKAAGALVKVIDFPRLRGINWTSAWQFVRAVKQVRHILQQEEIDLVISNTTRASYVATLAVLGTRVKLIWWVRDFLYPKKLFRLLFWRVSAAIFVSKAIKATYLPLNDPKGEVVYVASSLYKQLPNVTHKQIVSEKRQWGIEPDEIVVGFMGRLVADKGVEEVVEAARLLKDRPEIKFIIAGTGKNQMNDVEEKLKYQIQEFDLQNSVKMVGYQANEPLYYSMFDIFVLPTRDGEPFATSVVQAMMAQNAVIGSNAGGTPELVVNNETGILFTPGDAVGLSRAIVQLAGDDELRERLSAAGHDRVLQYHREEGITRQVETIFEQVLTDSTRK